MRNLDTKYMTSVKALGVSLVLFSIFALLFYPIDPWIFRAFHLFATSVLCFCLFPFNKKKVDTKPTILDWSLITISFISFLYIIIEFDELIYRAGSNPTSLDLIIGLLTVIIVLEMARRITGPALPIVALMAIIYALIGDYIPGIMGHKGYSFSRLTSIFYSEAGIYGTALNASASYALMFITLGAFINASGVGQLFTDIALSVAGRARGGPAKVAIIASAFFGTISGNAASNVATTGTFTIPLMKRVGYTKDFSGAVEAAASTGGQILPPVMGSVAFVLCEISGTPYDRLIIAATIPALLYFLSIFIMVDFEAINLNLKGLPKNELPLFKEALKQIYLLLPIVVLLISIFFLGKSIILSALYALLTTIVVSWINKSNRMNLSKIFEALYRGSRGVLNVASATACAGIVIGVIMVTGSGARVGSFLVAISGGNILLILFFAMLLCIILGMGMSTIPAYTISATVAAPALIGLGIAVVPAHLFVLYFACFSTITPPVCISAYTAAGISEGDPFKTGFLSFKLALAGFLVPYLFVFHPALLAIGSYSEVSVAIITSFIGIYALARGLQLRKITIVERIAFVCTALLLITPGYNSDVIGIIAICALLLGRIIYQRLNKSQSVDLTN